MGLLRQAKRLLAALLAVAVLVCVVADTMAPKNSPAMALLICDACIGIMQELGLDVKYLTESEKAWRPEDLRKRIKVAGEQACGYLMSDYHEAIAREIETRWHDDDETFEEDIVPKEFCMKVG